MTLFSYNWKYVYIGNISQLKFFPQTTTATTKLSQNHQRIAWFGRDFKDHLDPTVLPWAELPPTSFFSLNKLKSLRISSRERCSSPLSIFMSVSEPTPTTSYLSGVGGPRPGCSNSRWCLTTARSYMNTCSFANKNVCHPHFCLLMIVLLHTSVRRLQCQCSLKLLCVTKCKSHHFRTKTISNLFVQNQVPHTSA